MNGKTIKCQICRGTGKDLDGYPCKNCLGYGEMIEFSQETIPDFPETVQDVTKGNHA